MQGNATITVPISLLGDIQRMLDTMSVDDESAAPAESTEETENVEITRILNHRVGECNDFSFLVRTRKGEEFWISEAEANCEYLIQQYLSNQGITTYYLVCRVSTPEQATCASMSLEAQEGELRQNIPLHARVKVFKIKQSAYKNIPRDIQIIDESATRGSVVKIWRVDRLSRNIELFMETLRNWHERGIEIISHSEGLSYARNTMDFLQHMLDAQKEAAGISERIKLANRYKHERGDERVGRLPYGQKYERIRNPDGSTKKMIVVEDPTHWRVIRDICQKYRSRKHPTDITDGLNRRGIKKGNRKWTRSMVDRIIYKHYRSNFS